MGAHRQESKREGGFAPPYTLRVRDLGKLYVRTADRISTPNWRSAFSRRSLTIRPIRSSIVRMRPNTSVLRKLRLLKKDLSD
jgi:hypothetical protein